MKIKYKQTKLKPGMTLIEITVVILVLLTLISVLFIGATIYKAGADRAACILNQRNVQQAVRAHQNLNALVNKDKIVFANVIYSETKSGGVERYLSAPVCPAGGTYVALDAVPELSILALPCSLATSDNHVPKSIVGW